MKKRILLLLLFVLQISFFNYNYAFAEGPKNYLKGKFYSSVKDHFLIATKKMEDNRFEKTVIVMLESDKNGAWGVTINRLLGTFPIAFLIDSSLNTKEERKELYEVNIQVFWGGPVEEKKIFVLHSNEYKSESTINFGSISVSKDYDILLDIAKNKGPGSGSVRRQLQHLL